MSAFDSGAIVTATLIDVFFYGLYMDEEVLRSLRVEPRQPRVAFVDGYRLRIGKRATLTLAAGARAWGMVYALTEAEVEALYAGAGLDEYRPEQVVATFDDGNVSTVTTFTLTQVPTAEQCNRDYEARLNAVLARRGFPPHQEPSAA